MVLRNPSQVRSRAGKETQFCDKLLQIYGVQSNVGEVLILRQAVAKIEVDNHEKT
jgi:hypothetical protein